MSILTFTTLAYVGPGAGLGALGALFAVIAALFLGLIGLILYPLQVLRKRISRRPLHGERDGARSEKVPTA